MHLGYVCMSSKRNEYLLKRLVFTSVYYWIILVALIKYTLEKKYKKQRLLEALSENTT
jgi:hypothetical protein